jgi:SAM-dependent methyltransferase
MPETREWAIGNDPRPGGNGEVDHSEGLVSDPNDHQSGYIEANRAAWDQWAALGSVASRPVEALDPRSARLLLDPDGWLPWREIHSVVCLAAGGGQQAPAFAMLGCDVTVVDSSAGQLAIDAEVADKLGLRITCVEADMTDLADIGIADVDLVYQPISSCYTADIAGVYRQIHDVLRPSGLYRTEHWNPVHMRLWITRQHDERGYLLTMGDSPTAPLVTTVTYGPAGESLLESWTFPHSLESLLGGLCDAGFLIRRLAEDRGGDPDAPNGSEAHLSAIIPPFFRLLARRTQ